MEQQVIKLQPDWEKEPSLAELKYDFEQCQSSHSAQLAKLNRWETNYQVKKIGQSKQPQKGSSIQPNLIRKQAEWRCPALSEAFLSSPDLFKVAPVTHDDVARANQNQLILNNQFATQIDKTAFIDRLVRKLVRQGTAIIRTGWEYEERVEKTEVPQWAYQPAPPEAIEQLQPYMEMMEAEPDSFSQLDEGIQESVKKTAEAGFPVIAQQVGVEVVEDVVVVTNKPTAELCNIRNVYIDPTCEGNLDKAQFVIYSFESSLAELKKDGRYKNLEHIRIENADSSSSEFHSYQDNSFKFQDNPRKKLTVYEYWGYRAVDDSNTVKPIVAAWVGNVLIRLEDNPFPDKKPPFVVVTYIPEDNSIYGIPDGELLEDNQKILGAVTRGAIDLLAKSANSQTGVAKGLLDSTNRIRFRNGDDYEYNPNGNPQSSIYMHKYPEIPQSAMWLINSMNTDAEAISGVKAFSGQGISGAGLGQTAAGVRSAMDAASKREMSVLRRISEGVVKVGRKILAMNFEWLSEEETVRITNTQFVKVRRDDLVGQFDLSLSISTAEADEAKAQELAMMLQTIGNNMDAGMRNMILADIARLRRMPELAYRLESYKPEPDPMQQQLQELQMAKLQAEVAYLNAQAQEASAKSQVQGMKVNVEQARAESLQGDADLKAQNFVDKQTGVAHQRDLDKKLLDTDAQLSTQQLKNEGSLEKQIAQFGLSTQASKQKHNSDLLKMKAEQSLSTEQPLI